MVSTKKLLLRLRGGEKMGLVSDQFPRASVQPMTSRFTTISLLLVSLLSANRGLLAQSTEHVTAVKTAFRAAYAIT
jgi:hypothetical protein